MEPVPPQVIFPSTLRSIHVSGNWGTNATVWREWEAAGKPGTLIPADYIAWLNSVHANWVGISVALHYDDSMDSTVERVYVSEEDEHLIPAFTDEVLRQIVRELKSNDFEVYLTLAFEAHSAEQSARPVKRWQLGLPDVPDGVRSEHWPWRPDHPDHQRFIAEFWETYTQQAVHFARLAAQEGVVMYSLGTETDRLFRTRSGGHWPNHFGTELKSMVAGVRAVYDGLLTYDMHYTAVISDFFHPGSTHLWDDLSLDVVGISAWFPLLEAPPAGVVATSVLEQSYENIFRRWLIPLAKQNPGRPIVFTEYGAIDVVRAPYDSGGDSLGDAATFVDRNGNGRDDGQEAQANMFQALFNTMRRHPDVIHGAFFWDNWLASDETWDEYWADRRTFSIRDKISEDVVRATYEDYR